MAAMHRVAAAADVVVDVVAVGGTLIRSQSNGLLMQSLW